MRTPLAALVLFLCTASLCTAGLAQDRSLTLYTSLAPTESGPLAQAFEKKTGIKVELWRAISEKVVQRAITEARARRFAVDVVETNAPEMEMMAREKLFAELDSPYLADLPAAAVPKHRMRSVWNSLLLAVTTATLVMLVSAVICWIVVKTKLRGRWLLDNFASLPMVFPGIVLGLAIMILYLYLPIGVYGTIWIMLIAYVTRFMPYGLRYNTTSMLQIHKELEESAAMSGASWATAFRRIILPLLKPGLVAGWIYIVIVSIRELSSSILLYSPGTEVISILIWELWENGQYVELSALGVMFIIGLFFLVLVAQAIGKRFGIREA